MGFRLQRLYLDVRGRQNEVAAPVHRIARVDRQIENSGLKLVRVRLAEPKIGYPTNLDLHGFADGPVQERFERRQQMGDAYGLLAHVLTPCERQQLFVQARASRDP